MDLLNKRNSSQIYFEELLGCTDPTKLKDFQDKAKELRISVQQSRTFRNFSDLETSSFLAKGLISLIYAIVGLEKHRTTWSLVKLYYSVYYFLRTEMYLNDQIMLRANQIFFLKCVNGEAPKKFNNRKAKGDHGILIEYFKRKFSTTDILLSQTIDDTDVYTWLKEKRELVQYKTQDYVELNSIELFFPFDQMSISDQISMFLKDQDPYFCFDADYAALAIPIKRAQLTIRSFKSSGLQLGAAATNEIHDIAHGSVAAQRIVGLI